MAATCCERVILPESFEFRLRFAHRIVTEMRRTHQQVWTRDDLGTLLLEVLEDEYDFDWYEPGATDKFKEYVAAGHVLPASQRSF